MKTTIAQREKEGPVILWTVRLDTLNPSVRSQLDSRSTRTPRDARGTQCTIGAHAPRPSRLKAGDRGYAAEQTDCEELLSPLNNLEEKC